MAMKLVHFFFKVLGVYYYLGNCILIFKHNPIPQRFFFLPITDLYKFLNNTLAPAEFTSLL